MQPQRHVPLAKMTSLAAGGAAETLYTCTTAEECTRVLDGLHDEQLWMLGYGANVLISDRGLPGVTMLMRSHDIHMEDDLLVCDGGAWWDDVVRYSIDNGWWGLELMSAIPGGVGAAVVGNIAAYGQAVASTLRWVEVYDRTLHATRRLNAEELGLGYRYSLFQTPEFKDLVILRAAFKLSRTPVTELVYQTAIDIALEISADTDTLDGRRATILETRRRAGSLWDYRRPDENMRTAGSFFRNPFVSAEKAEELMAYDETGRSSELLRKMNLVHGGDQKRVSAAHVLLAAGFQRGQSWGPVRLHPDHILKIENTGDASAQQIYDVAEHIIQTVRDRLSIELVPEVRFLGDFS
ncbi:MAG TPA: FAD-binding protein [Candidatus Saccharimonadales bacterium]|nr:FAD-binding protein [Candidatus Saccharimonadales bacterium]